MIKVEQFMNIKELKTEGHSIRAISRMTGQHRNTISKVLAGEHNMIFNKPHRASKLDPYKTYLKERFETTGLSAIRLFDEIKPMGYKGSLATLRRYLATLKPIFERLNKLTVRFETPAGKQAQVDWTYCGQHKQTNRGKVSVYAFVMILSYSRMMFVHFTNSMKLPELLNCHKLAFEYFNGWTHCILYDNMKQVKISRNKWNEGFLDFVNHYGIVPKTHQVYRPRTKGKVERVMTYLKDNFLKAREFSSMDELNSRVLSWLNKTANNRIHATTGQKPIDLFAKEQLNCLKSIKPYHIHQQVQRKVNYESMLHFQGSRYSVPPEYAGKTVNVDAPGGWIIIRSSDLIIAEHPQAQTKGMCITDKEHLEQIWKLSVKQTPIEKGPNWSIKLNADVQKTSLETYERICQ